MKRCRKRKLSLQKFNNSNTFQLQSGWISLKILSINASRLINHCNRPPYYSAFLAISFAYAFSLCLCNFFESIRRKTCCLLAFLVYCCAFSSDGISIKCTAHAIYTHEQQPIHIRAHAYRSAYENNKLLRAYNAKGWNMITCFDMIKYRRLFCIRISCLLRLLDFHLIIKLQLKKSSATWISFFRSLCPSRLCPVSFLLSTIGWKLLFDVLYMPLSVQFSYLHFNGWTFGFSLK